jgi:ribonuclease HI
VSEAVEIFTDGSCKGNPGPGGWAYPVRHKDGEYRDSAGEWDTTNQRMELSTAIMALKTLPEKSTVRIDSDSQYLVKGMTEWIQIWVSTGWKTYSEKPVDNLDLWRQLYQLTHDTLFTEGRQHVEWIHVPAHAGHRENENLDKMANDAMKEFL